VDGRTFPKDVGGVCNRRENVRCAVPVEGFVIDEAFWICVVLCLCRDIDLRVMARKLSVGHNSNFGKLRLGVCTLWCIYGSTDRGEHSSRGKRWMVTFVQRARCPLVCRPLGGQGREWSRLRKVAFVPTNLSRSDTMRVLFVQISW
jgi:hypothetical protein